MPIKYDKQLVTDLKWGIRNGPYVFPGGYPKFLVLTDGEALCFTCVKENYKLILQAARTNHDHSGWCPAAFDINWENPDLYCAHCNKRIESAYAEPEEAS